MTQTVNGTITGIPAKRQFIAKFTIDEQLFTFLGSIADPDTGFPSAPSQAKLTYDTLSQLKGSRPFKAAIGKPEKTVFKVELSNGVTMDGKLSVIAPVPGEVSGSGTWSGDGAL